MISAAWRQEKRGHTGLAGKLVLSNKKDPGSVKDLPQKVKNKIRWKATEEDS